MQRDANKTQPPRPQNCFVLFKKEMNDKVQGTFPQKSKIIGRMWQEAPEEVKNHYKVLSEEDKLAHALKYPGYQFKPQQKKPKGTRATRLQASSPYPTQRNGPISGSSTDAQSNASTPYLSSGSSSRESSAAASEHEHVDPNYQHPPLTRLLTPETPIEYNGVLYEPLQPYPSDAATQLMWQSFDVSAQRSASTSQVSHLSPLGHPPTNQNSLSTFASDDYTHYDQENARATEDFPETAEEPISLGSFSEEQNTQENLYQSTDTTTPIHRTDYNVPLPSIVNALIPVSAPAETSVAEPLDLTTLLGPPEQITLCPDFLEFCYQQGFPAEDEGISLEPKSPVDVETSLEQASNVEWYKDFGL